MKVNRTDKITIIGCGNLGSMLAYLIALRSNEEDVLPLQQLTLIDNDYIEIKNTPYVYIGQIDQIINKPKVMILADIIKTHSSLEVITKFETFEGGTNMDNSNFIIDCRDCSSESDCCNMKVNLDGFFGLINIKPTNLKVEKNSKYMIGSSRYYANIFSGIITQIIFDGMEIPSSKSIVQLKTNSFIPVSVDF